MRGDCAEAVTFPPALYSLGIRSLDWGMREVRIPHQGQPQIEDPNLIYPGDTVISQPSCSTRS
jgi:hypothetical protein